MARFRGQATLEVMAIAILMFLVQLVLASIGYGVEMFALAAPLLDRPWTIITAVYAHGSLDHLIANLVGLVLFGLLVERRSTRGRFHAFVLLTGVIAALAQIVIATLLGSSAGVLGISGAVFALMGYLLTSNPVTESVIGWFQLNARAQLVLMFAMAIAITWVTWGEQVAVFGHFAGFSLGLLAGRMHVLRVDQAHQSV